MLKEFKIQNLGEIQLVRVQLCEMKQHIKGKTQIDNIEFENKEEHKTLQILTMLRIRHVRATSKAKELGSLATTQIQKQETFLKNSIEKNRHLANSVR